MLPCCIYIVFKTFSFNSTIYLWSYFGSYRLDLKMDVLIGDSGFPVTDHPPPPPTPTNKNNLVSISLLNAALNYAS